MAQPAIKRQPKLMLFHIRRKDGSSDPFSAGPYVDGDNRSMHRQRVGQAPVFQSFGPQLAIHRRYTERPFLCVPYCYLQGITVRPVPCNYYVIQQDIALSRRKRGFKSRRGRQFNNLWSKPLSYVEETRCSDTRCGCFSAGINSAFASRNDPLKPVAMG